MISLSRSTISLNATLCTLPADRPLWIFLQSSGETSNPTRRSSTLRACWAMTRSMSMLRGFCNAFSTALFVISWKAMRFVGLFSRPSVW